MKKYTFFCSIFLLLSLSGNAQRHIFWLGGPSLTSTDWSNAQLGAQNAGYDFSNVNISPYDFNNIANSIPDWANFFNDKLNTNNLTDVLAIGHDAGGLIIRYMDMTQQGNLSAMILNGTPNQGANIVRKLIPQTPGQPSEFQSILTERLALRSRLQNCNACQIIELTQQWANGFAQPAIANYYQQYSPTNTVITNIAAQPNIPHAVIWGNEDDDAYVLTRLIGSYYRRGLDAYDENLLTCYRNQIELRKRDVKEKQTLALLNNLVQFATLVGLTAATISAPNPVSATAAAAIFNNLLNITINGIRNNAEISDELLSILECELIHQALNVEWDLMVSTYQQQSMEVTDYYCVECDLCDDEPDPQVRAWCFHECTLNCDPSTQTTMSYTNTVYYLAREPHDGFLTRSEQELAGAVPPYEAKGANHIQEQFWGYTSVNNAFQDLFNGGAGAAFVVPE